MKKTLVILAVMVVVVLIGVLSAPGRELIVRNQLSLDALNSAESGDTERMLRVARVLEEKAQERCAYYWQSGRLIFLANGTNIRYIDLIGCSFLYIQPLQVFNPLDHEMAIAAVKEYPESAITNFWLAETLSRDKTEQAERLYERVIQIDPTYGLALCRLGYIYEARDEVEPALHFFESCCLYDDPGLHGCYGAGRMYEKIGDIPGAINWYQLSTFDKALNRATELRETQK